MWLQAVGCLNLSAAAPSPPAPVDRQCAPGPLVGFAGSRARRLRCPGRVPGHSARPLHRAFSGPSFIRFENEGACQHRAHSPSPGHRSPGVLCSPPAPTLLSDTSTPFPCSVAAAVPTGVKFGHEMNSGERSFSRFRTSPFPAALRSDTSFGVYFSDISVPAVSRGNC